MSLSLDYRKAPEVSEQTIQALKNFNGLDVKPLDYKIARSATILKSLETNLVITKKAPFANIIAAVVRSGVNCALIAGGVLGVLFTGWPFLTACAATFIYTALAFGNARYDAVFPEPFTSEQQILIFLSGAVLPLFALIGKEARLEGAIARTKANIAFNLSDRKALFASDRMGNIIQIIENTKGQEKIAEELKANVAFYKGF